MTEEIHHRPARRQGWADADDDIRDWTLGVVRDVGTVLGAELVGVYLHGSLAMSSYYRPKSDLDVLFVVRTKQASETRRALARLLLAASDNRPTTGDIEASVITIEHAQNFVHPLPFEVHFGENLAEAIRTNRLDFNAERTDSDLAAHLTVTRQRGIALVGPPPIDLFGTVSADDYLDAVMDDFNWIVSDHHIVESPYYGVLNCCRVLQLVADGPEIVASKEEGGRWALAHLPEEHRRIIQQALDCYRSSAAIKPADRRTHGHAWDQSSLLRFAAFSKRITDSDGTSA